MELVNIDEYLNDLNMISYNWTGRGDLLIANTFLEESIQLIANAMFLFEDGYFDCAFYSLRQSIEISTVISYLSELDDKKKEEQLSKWKKQGSFPMFKDMVKFLTANQCTFHELNMKMKDLFKQFIVVKDKLNKYIHKQGLRTFYTSRNHPLSNIEDDLSVEFVEYLEKCISAVAVMRLTLDPLPLLLLDQEIFYRTPEFMAEGYSEEFVEKYIGDENVERFKETSIYQSFYDYFITQEKRTEAMKEFQKFQFIDSITIDELLEQKTSSF